LRKTNRIVIYVKTRLHVYWNGFQANAVFTSFPCYC